MGYQGHRAAVEGDLPGVSSSWKAPGGSWGHQGEKHARPTNRATHIAGYVRRSVASKGSYIPPTQQRWSASARVSSAQFWSPSVQEGRGESGEGLAESLQDSQGLRAHDLPLWEKVTSRGPSLPTFLSTSHRHNPCCFWTTGGWENCGGVGKRRLFHFFDR